jgi:hypothetical protein
MSAGSSWGETPRHGAVKAAVVSFVRAHGLKRGLHLAAQAIGIGQRAARHAYEGTPFAADEDRAARADAARLALLRDQIARLRAEADELQRRGANDEAMAMAGTPMDRRGSVLRGARHFLLSTGGVA